ANVWGGGNPIAWWAASVAIAITATRAVVRPTFSRAFLVIGYLSYWIVLMASPRRLYLHLFMPSIYFGYVALGGLLAESWRGEISRWEEAALLLTIAPGLMFGLGLKIGLLAFLMFLG